MGMIDNPGVQAWLAEHPEQEGWVRDQDRQWDVGIPLREQGCTFGQAASALGQVPDQLDAEELEEQLEKETEERKKLEVICTRGLAENRALREENEELRTKLRAALAQLAAQRERPSRQRGRRGGVNV